jgi:hypothetical protein
VLWAGVFDSKKGHEFTFVYKDSMGAAWGKRVRVERFITNKVYPLAKEGSQGIEFLSDKKNPGKAILHMVPAKRQKVKSVVVDLGAVPPCGLSARGTRLTVKPMEKVELMPEGATMKSIRQSAADGVRARQPAPPNEEKKDSSRGGGLLKRAAAARKKAGRPTKKAAVKKTSKRR